MVDWARRNPGLALLGLALAAAIALYAPTLSAELVGSDDTWLVRDNAIVQHPSWANLHTIFFELDPAHRFVLGVEYLPVRDLSLTLDVALWGDWLPGFHLTNLLLYLGAIALWFGVLDGFGVDRTVCGLAMLIWALHPCHAETVSWLAERKGLLGVMFSGLVGLAYVRYRAGRSTAWLALAVVATLLGVWSKAHASFAIAALAPLSWVFPGPRRRTLIGLGAIAVVGVLAFAPVVILASRADIVGGSPTNRAALILGVHGFYARLATMTIANAYSYPMQTHGPMGLDVALGAAALLALLVGLLPRWPAPVRAGCVLWLVGWFPVSHILLPLQMVILADRYILVPSLGFALLVGYGLSRLPRFRTLAIAVVALAAAARTFAAQAGWHDARALWGRAVESNPDDGGAWSMYAHALEEAHEPERAAAAVAEGLAHDGGARLLMRQALLELERGDRAAGIATMKRAAEAGDARAMANYALLANDVAWARRATAAEPLSVHAWRTLGKVALATAPAEARAAFVRAVAIQPTCTNRYNLALAELALAHPADAVPLLEPCAADPELGAQVRAALDRTRR